MPKTRPGVQVFVAGDEPEILGTPGLCLKRGAVDEEANLARECEEAAAEILPRDVGAVTAEPGDEGKRCFFPRPLKKQKVAPRRKDFRIRSSHPVPARPMELACDERGVNYPVEGVGRNHYFPSRAGSPAFNVESRLYLFFTECMDRLPTFDELNRYWPTQRVTNHYGSVVARFEMGVSYHCMPCGEDGREGSAMTREDLDAHRKGGACAIELPGRVDRMALNFAFALREAYRLRTAWLKYKSEGRMRA